MTGAAGPTMRAMLLEAPRQPLRLAEWPRPVPGPDEVLIAVRTCGVCRTDLHVADGDLVAPRLPLILGHEIVGTVAATGSLVRTLRPGQRVGVPWLGRTCGQCEPCRSGHENLCDQIACTGWQRDGGYAEYAVADARFVFPLPEGYSDAEAAPLLCAGLIGYRALVAAGAAPRLGIYGFGAAAHLMAQVARARGQQVFAFTRPGDRAAQHFAQELGAAWAGDSTATPPGAPLDAAILFAPVGSLVPAALRAVRPGGTVVCAGIHMSDIPTFPYAILWGERVLRSVAHLTRRDAEEFLRLAPTVPVRTTVEVLPLAAANHALERLRRGQLTGALVLDVAGPG